jgi:hypothetical protein
MNWKNGRPKGTVKAVWQKTGMAIKKKKNYNRLLQVQMKYFQNGGTSGNRRHLYFFKWKGLILASHFDSTLNFEFRASFCQHLSVIVFDLCHLFCKKARLQGFINKFITLEPSEINNRFFLVEFLKT